MVHRALLGSLERFFGVLVEHYNGAFPLWLAPVQALVLPIAERHEDYARALVARLEAAGLRAEADLSREKVGKKIRGAELQKVPLILVVGDKEVERGSAALRVHGQGDKGEIALDRLLERAVELVKTKSLSVSF
jgi:threonyl-tRNA synthetase